MPLDRTYISPHIQRRSVLLVVRKRERAATLSAFLESKGIDVRVALSLYEASAALAEHLPHLVVSESVFEDGTVDQLQKKLDQLSLQKGTPIFGLVQKKVDQEILPLKACNLVGLMVGQVNPPMLYQKLLDFFKSDAYQPRFQLLADAISIEPEVKARISAEILGRSSDQVVFASSTMVDREAIFTCIPADAKRAPVELFRGTNIAAKEGFFNVFPFALQRGAGREWVNQLDPLELGFDAHAANRKVLFHCAEGEDFSHWQSLLSPYSYSLVSADSWELALEELRRSEGAAGCVVLFETLEDFRNRKRASFLKDLHQIPNRPNVIVFTEGPLANAEPGVRFVSYPCGLGTILECLEAGFERYSLYQEADKADALRNKAVPVQYELRCSIMALDEVGGVMQSAFPVLSGSKISLDEPALNELWQEQPEVRISAVGRNPKSPDMWQMRFDWIQPGQSKLRYWEKVRAFFGIFDDEEQEAVS